MLQVMAYFQVMNVSVYTLLLLLSTAPTWQPGNHSKATLNRRKGIVLISVHLVGLAMYTTLTMCRQL